jgi:hypothetical protein
MQLLQEIRTQFSSIATPLINLTKSEIPFEWNLEKGTAFTQLKEALMNTPILRCADSSLPYEVQTDASETHSQHLAAHAEPLP